MSDLSTIPTAILIAELHRREAALTLELTSLLDWRAPATLPATAAADGARIVREVAAAADLSEAVIMGRSRVPRVARARQIAMVQLLNTGISLCDVGRFFDRDHGTVMHALKVIKQSAQAS